MRRLSSFGTRTERQVAPRTCEHGLKIDWVLLTVKNEVEERCEYKQMSP